MDFRKLLFFCLSFMCLAQTYGQNITVTGVVQDDVGNTIPGATVLQKGTAVASLTDIDGKYDISVDPQSTLVFSSLGYGTFETAVNAQPVINATLKQTSESLDEIVVVGYGTQKKSVVTGSISSIKASELENLPITRVEQSIQGRAAGVFVAANAGQPGSNSTIRIRGITTLNNNDPLWVVDGVVIDNGGIGYLNQSDILSIEVLKDAASAAIYGSRGATGVILVTTKKGKTGDIRVNYNGFTGVSSPARKLDLLNATQYATLRNEAYSAGYNGAPGNFVLPYANPESLGRGTDWQDQIFNENAKRASHELSISGGNEKSTFYMSFGLIDQEGIVASQISNYIRKNITLNSNHKINEYITVGQSFSYSHQKYMGIGNTNSEYGGPLSSAINLDPVTPVVVTDINSQPNATEYANNAANLVYDANGNPYGISNAVGQEMTNPLAYTQTRLGNYGWGDDFIGNVFVEATLVKNLKFRSTVGGKLSNWGGESFTPRAYLNATNNASRNNLSRNTNSKLDWNVENTLSYTFNIKNHNFSALFGQSYYVDNQASGQGTTYFDLPVNTFQEASFQFDVPAANRETYAYDNYAHNVSSLFGRLNYNYQEKYLLTGIIRRDGSTRFGGNNKYGYFPSMSLGWVLTKEDFWNQNDFVNMFKLRGGFGIVGNDSAADLAYLPLISGGNNYTVGTDGQVIIGNSPDRPANPDLKWEETLQKNIGFDATFFKNLNVSFDLYEKETSGILRPQPLPGYVGADQPPIANVADMQNRGVELELSYGKQFGQVNFKISGNVAFVKNEVTHIGQDAQFINGPTVQSSAYPISRTEVGHAYGEFYGFQTNGIFQNQEEINSYTSADGTVIQPNAQPGDFRWKDLDGNGEIDDKDRTYLGSPLPNCTFGFTINLDYKGFDLLIFAQGAAGNEIYKGLRRLDIPNANWQTDALNRWTGEGTSNDYPRLTTADTNLNFSRPSDFYIEDGDYLRFKTVQLGYSLPVDVIKTAGLTKTRIYLTAENLLTFTKYSGFDPEIGGDVMGIDRGYYPQATSVMLGVNLQF
jgi:TonB-linked SusC/RagA family outer membrane protein